MDVQKGDRIMFRSNFGEKPSVMNTAIVTRAAKDRSWVDVESVWGRKRVPVLDDNFRVIKRGGAKT